MADARQIYARIEKIARGAALMTETSVTCRFEKACSSYLPNRTLEAAMYQAVCHYGTPSWSKEDRAFADQIRATLSENDLNNSLKISPAPAAKRKNFARRHRDTVLIDEVAPWAATDNIWQGQPMWATSAGKPGRPMFQPCFAVGTPLHTAAGEPGPHGHRPQGDAAGRKSARRHGDPPAHRRRAAASQSTRTGATAGGKAISLPDPARRDTVTFKIKQ